ncbi:uncharacterized protein LOC141716660 isoform X2 [Apium graveolens]
MATIKDLPRELLYHIIIMLVQSVGGAEEFARIIAVCRDFVLYVEDKSILRVIKFDIKMEPVKFYLFQNVKGLLVKCSEAGNEAAQHVLGKVIMLSSTHLFLSERQQVRSSLVSRDRSMIKRWIPKTNVPAQNNKVRSFMTYFSPMQVYTSEFSTTRFVHYQLVKLFLLNGSHHDFIEMDVFLKYCIMYFMGVTRENSCLIASVKLLYMRSRCVRSLEMTIESFNDYFRGVREYLEVIMTNLDSSFQDPSSAQSGNSSEMGVETRNVLDHYMWKCGSDGVNWRVGLNDIDFVEAVREDISNRLDVLTYPNFNIRRAETLGLFERLFG